MPNFFQKAATRWKKWSTEYPWAARILKWVVTPLAAVLGTIQSGLVTYLTRLILWGTLVVQPSDPAVSRHLDADNILIKVRNLNIQRDTLIRQGVKTDLEPGYYSLGLVDSRSSPPKELPEQIYSITVDTNETATLTVSARKTLTAILKYGQDGQFIMRFIDAPRDEKLTLSVFRQNETIVDTSILGGSTQRRLTLAKGVYSFKVVQSGRPVYGGDIEISSHGTVEDSLVFGSFSGRISPSGEGPSLNFQGFTIEIGMKKGFIGDDGTFIVEGLALRLSYDYKIFNPDGTRRKAGRLFNSGMLRNVRLPDQENGSITM